MLVWSTGWRERNLICRVLVKHHKDVRATGHKPHRLTDKSVKMRLFLPSDVQPGLQELQSNAFVMSVGVSSDSVTQSRLKKEGTVTSGNREANNVTEKSV